MRTHHYDPQELAKLTAGDLLISDTIAISSFRCELDGNIDIDRLLSGKSDIYSSFSPTESKEPKFKDLIITDWSLRYCLDVRDWMELIEKLTAYPFKFHVWTSKGLVHVKSGRELIENLYEVAPVRREEISLSVPNDEMLVIDYFKARELMNLLCNKTYLLRTLYLNDLELQTDIKFVEPFILDAEEFDIRISANLQKDSIKLKLLHFLVEIRSLQEECGVASSSFYIENFLLNAHPSQFIVGEILEKYDLFSKVISCFELKLKELDFQIFKNMEELSFTIFEEHAERRTND